MRPKFEILAIKFVFEELTTVVDFTPVWPVVRTV